MADLVADTRRRVEQLRGQGHLPGEQADLVLRLLDREERYQRPRRQATGRAPPDAKSQACARHRQAPPERLIQVLVRNLSSHDLGSARRVCKDWARMLDASQRKLRVRLDNAILASICGAHLATGFAALEELKVDARPAMGRHCKRLASFLEPLSSMAELRRLQCQADGISDSLLQAVSCMGNLDHLGLELKRFHRGMYIYDSDDSRECFDACPLTVSGFRALAEGLTRLQSLSISCELYSGRHTELLDIPRESWRELSKMTSLKSLRICALMPQLDIHLAGLAAQLTGLTALSLTGKTHISPQDLSALQPLSALQELGILFCSDDDVQEDAGYQFPPLPSLTILDIHDMALTDTQLAQSMFPTNLERLALRSCLRLQGSGLTVLAGLCSLKDLELSLLRCRAPYMPSSGLRDERIAGHLGALPLERLFLAGSHNLTWPGLKQALPQSLTTLSIAAMAERFFQPLAEGDLASVLPELKDLRIDFTSIQTRVSSVGTRLSWIRTSPQQAAELLPRILTGLSSLESLSIRGVGRPEPGTETAAALPAILDQMRMPPHLLLHPEMFGLPIDGSKPLPEELCRLPCAVLTAWNPGLAEEPFAYTVVGEDCSWSDEDDDKLEGESLDGSGEEEEEEEEEEGFQEDVQQQQGLNWFLVEDDEMEDEDDKSSSLEVDSSDGQEVLAGNDDEEGHGHDQEEEEEEDVDGGSEDW
eukprot:CAMPEP_0117662118 /NCGR_PEP_ID=MMETSP0804-20121206/7889_1 /TAXON_ID=1074897 /ORGANISM="Tetraselmis astigmatica, Strain CCMP880" /LENGTH=705 /DNA_ID=CAMNT_0005469009 /DNA_START=74 /DNA_END=2191 /DNA_ORIENTATION=+